MEETNQLEDEVEFDLTRRKPAIILVLQDYFNDKATERHIRAVLVDDGLFPGEKIFRALMENYNYIADKCFEEK